jgi:hypothetical protein
MYGTEEIKQHEENIEILKKTLCSRIKGGGLIAKGCGKVMGDRRKVTKMY